MDVALNNVTRDRVILAMSEELGLITAPMSCDIAQPDETVVAWAILLILRYQTSVTRHEARRRAVDMTYKDSMDSKEGCKAPTAEEMKTVADEKAALEQASGSYITHCRELIHEAVECEALRWDFRTYLIRLEEPLGVD